MDVILPEQMIGDDSAIRVNDGDRSAEWEPLVALKV
jgi:hypothetical protein